VFTEKVYAREKEEECHEKAKTKSGQNTKNVSM
jgi:hypothetical protein